MQEAQVETQEVDTPTTARLKAERAARPKKFYSFHLTADDASRVAGLGDAAMLAYALICAAAWGPRRHRWVTVPPRSMEAVNRGYRWWHGATKRLVEGGLIEVQRLRGQKPRYRLLPDRDVLLSISEEPGMRGLASDDAAVGGEGALAYVYPLGGSQ